MGLFHCAFVGTSLIFAQLSAETPPPPILSFHASFFRNPPRHLTFQFPFPSTLMCRGPHLQRAAAVPGNALFPKLRSHQPPTEPRLSGTEQMYHTHNPRAKARSRRPHKPKRVTQAHFFATAACRKDLRCLCWSNSRANTCHSS